MDANTNENKDSEFGNSNVSESINQINSELSETLSKMETLLTLPIDYIKSNMSHDDFTNYLNMRSKTIDLLNLLEVFVYDTHEEQNKCVMCNEKVAQIVTRRRFGKEVETINGEVEHWVAPNGQLTHIFICEDCLKSMRRGEL